ncbi:MAG: TonB-dependent receptor [Candidatus Synoicihabitans palmerolidicus]|nr:TonB-dependent receptor [Candidatus Synoicihabitans palmerolidicus]
MQFLYDYQYQDKRSQLPFNQRPEITASELKYTLIRNAKFIPFLSNLPDWMNLHTLTSVNIRYTDGGRIATSGDYDQRRDLITDYRPTDSFTSWLITDDRSFETGEPISTNRFSDFVETGIGSMIDLTIKEKLNFVGGARYDHVDATTDEGERFSRFNVGSATDQMLSPRSATGTDDGVSYSGRVNYKTGIFGLTPYFPMGESSAVLTGSDQTIAYGNVTSGNILGAAELREAGLKVSAMEGKLFYAVSAYRQIRSSSVEEEGVSFISSTKTKGIEAELRFVPNRHLSIILSGTWQSIRYHKVGSSNALVTASYVGFEDVLDPATGEVLFPADAFLFGGNAYIRVDTDDPRYNKYGQYPDEVYGACIGYNFDNGFGLSWNTTYVSSVSASSLVPDLLILPSSLSHPASVYWQNDTWRFAWNARNVGDEKMWTPNTGSFGGVTLQPGLPRNYEFAMTRKF